MLLDRVEWTSSCRSGHRLGGAAERRGRLVGEPDPDLVPLLRKNANINVDIADPLGNIGAFRMNHLHPPFDNPKIRQAVLMGMNQEDYMRSLIGGRRQAVEAAAGFFTPGTPLYSEAGGQKIGKGDIAAAKKLLAEAGYKGEPVVCVVAQDQSITKNMGDVTADLLKQMGMKVDFVATGLGHGGHPPRLEGAAVAGRLEHVPHLACRRRLHQPGGLSGDPGQWRQGLVRLARPARRSRPASPSGSMPRSGRREGGDRQGERGGGGRCRLRADRLLPRLPGLAQDRDRRGQGAAALHLGRVQGLRNPRVRFLVKRVPRRHPGDGGRRAVRVQPAVPRPRRPGGADCRRPGLAGRYRAHPRLARPRPAVPWSASAEWAWRILHGDLGTSIFTNLPVTTMIGQRVQPTVSLMLVTLIFAVLVAVPLGVLAAWKAGRLVDRLVMGGAVLGFSVPVFVVGYLLAYVFALELGWLPAQATRRSSRGSARGSPA